MKEVRIKLYHFDELSEDAKKVVRDRERERIQQWGIDAWDSEHKETLKKFCEIFNVKVYDWEVSDYNHDYRFKFTQDFYDISADKVTGRYLLRFLNSIYYDIRSRKYFSCGQHYDENGKFHYSHRHSRIMWEEYNCPLTGVCYDNDILDPIWKWHKKPNFGISLYELVDDCLESFFSTWQNECEYCGSDEYVEQELIESGVYEDTLWYSDGTEFNGIYEDAA